MINSSLFENVGNVTQHQKKPCLPVFELHPLKFYYLFSSKNHRGTDFTQCFPVLILHCLTKPHVSGITLLLKHSGCENFIFFYVGLSQCKVPIQSSFPAYLAYYTNALSGNRSHCVV